MHTAHSRALRFGAIIIAIGAAIPRTGLAQSTESWPARPVTLVSPVAAGGANDIVARIIAEGLQRATGQSFIVKAVPGAAGLIGTRQVMGSPPDGYTLLLGNVASMILQPVVKTPPPYHPVDSFTPIAKIAINHTFIGVAADVPVKNVAELVALARQSPGRLNYISGGNGSFGNFVTEYFKISTGTDILHIPGAGSGPAILELKAGRVQMMIDSLIPLHATDGRIKVLAVMSKARVASHPNIPTVKEAGGPDLEMVGWFGMFGPANLPRPVVDKLVAALQTVMAEPETARKMAELSIVPFMQSGAPFRSALKADLELYTDVKTRARLVVE